MSDISLDNVLPYRTRSGRNRAHAKGSLSPVKGSLPTTESVKLISTAAMCISILEECKEIRVKILEYIQNKKGREDKFLLMSKSKALSSKLQDFSKESSYLIKTLEDIELFSELLCWDTRFRYYHQIICVL